MKAMAIAVALLASSTALAQDYGTQSTTTMPDVSTPDLTTTTTTTTTTDSWATTPTSTTPAPASGQVVAASNANPEHDARGIAVISDPAVVPPGFNGLPAGAMGGPLVDPATGETVSATAETEYPPCTAEVTDNCLQTYERGRARD